MGKTASVPLPGSLDLLRMRNFQLFVFSGVATITGLWLFETVLYWTATQDGSATATGFVIAALVLPIVVLIVPMGVVADIWGDRKLLVISQAAWVVMMIAATLVAKAGLLSLKAVLILAIIEGVFAAVWTAPAQVMLARLVPRALMAKAVALGTLQAALGQIIGGYGAGELMSTVGPTATFCIAGACLALGLVITCLLKPTHEFARRPVKGAVNEALDFIRHTPVAVALCVIGCFTSLFLIGYSAVLPAVSRDLLHAGPQGLGWMTAAGGIGTLVAVWTIDPIGDKFGRGVSLVSSLAVACLAIALIGVSRSIGASVPLAGVVSGCLVVYGATNSIVLQSLSPEQMRGRVMSLITFLFLVLMPVGSIGSGLVADHLGVGQALLIMGLLTGACLAGVSIVYSPVLSVDVSPVGVFQSRPSRSGSVVQSSPFQRLPASESEIDPCSAEP